MSVNDADAGFRRKKRTRGSLLIKEGVPVKFVSERLGHSNIAFTMQTYQHVLPGMQADAARTTEERPDIDEGPGQ